MTTNKKQESAGLPAFRRALSLFVCAPSPPPPPDGRLQCGTSHPVCVRRRGEVAPQVLGSHFRTMRAHAGEQTELEAQATELRTHRAMEVQGELRAAAFDNCQELLCDGVRLMSMLQILQLFQVGSAFGPQNPLAAASYVWSFIQLRKPSRLRR